MAVSSFDRKTAGRIINIELVICSILDLQVFT